MVQLLLMTILASAFEAPAGAQKLCGGHVTGAMSVKGEPGPHITWTAYHSRESRDALVRRYMRTLGSKEHSRDRGCDRWRDGPDAVLEVCAVSEGGPWSECSSAPRDAKSIIMISSMARKKETVLFMCPYGGAKSVIAASYFNRIAAEQSLPFVAVAAAAETPYDAVPPNVAAFLEGEGFHVAGLKPRRVEASDLRGASRVVSIDCDLTKLDAQGAAVERWDDVPKVSVDLPGSAAAIRKHIATLVDQLKSRR